LFGSSGVPYGGVVASQDWEKIVLQKAKTHFESHGHKAKLRGIQPRQLRKANGGEGWLAKKNDGSTGPQKKRTTRLGVQPLERKKWAKVNEGRKQRKPITRKQVWRENLIVGEQERGRHGRKKVALTQCQALGKLEKQRKPALLGDQNAFTGAFRIRGEQEERHQKKGGKSKTQMGRKKTTKKKGGRKKREERPRTDLLASGDGRSGGRVRMDLGSP